MKYIIVKLISNSRSDFVDNITRRNKEMAYISDKTVMEQQKKARQLTQKLNTMDRSDFEGLQAIVKELLGKSENTWINPPFYCDYGFNIEAGKNLFINYNCTILDVAKVKIGDNVLIAPNVSIYTAGHPIHADTRKTGYEYGFSVTIKDNVWIGGNSVILPNVTVGSNSVIAAGSVVTKDVPEWTVVAGNPAKVIRKITDEDRLYYFKDKKFDDEALAHIEEILSNDELPNLVNQ